MRSFKLFTLIFTFLLSLGNFSSVSSASMNASPNLLTQTAHTTEISSTHSHQNSEQNDDGTPTECTSCDETESTSVAGAEDGPEGNVVASYEFKSFFIVKHHLLHSTPKLFSVYLSAPDQPPRA